MFRREFLALAVGQSLPDLYHGMQYGDPPARFEKGWTALLNGRDLSGWHGDSSKPNEWVAAGGVRWRRVFNPTKLEISKEPGDRIANGPIGKTVNLVSDAEFGDCELYLEFMLAKGSNSGVYMQGLYEVQVFDSYGHEGDLSPGDCGGIYESAEAGKSPGRAPTRNAVKPPGEWQAMRIWFQAPKFEGARKTANARIRRVILNGHLVQDDFELPGPTLSAMQRPESPRGPLMLQGDHAAIAYREIWIKPATA